MLKTLVLGASVRKYYDDDMFDEGEIIEIDDDRIKIDFYDWIECSLASTFVELDRYLEGIVLSLLVDGEIIDRFEIGRKVLVTDP